jgi:hypothetical protein
MCPVVLLGWRFDVRRLTTWEVLAGLFTDRVRDHLLAFGSADDGTSADPSARCQLAGRRYTRPRRTGR